MSSLSEEYMSWQAKYATLLGLIVCEENLPGGVADMWSFQDPMYL